MLIGIDGNEANIANRVGVNQFAFHLLWGMYESVDNSNDENLKFRIFLAEPPLSDLPPENDWWKYEVFGPKFLWTRTGLVKRLYLGKPKPDIIFSPSHYGPGFSPIPSITSIMDLGFLHSPEQFTRIIYWQLKHWTRRSVKQAARIITISNFSKQDIIDTYKIPAEKITVAYPGYEIKSQKGVEKNLEIVKKKYDLPKKYILYLGTLKPNKNIDKLIRSYKLLITNYELKDTCLVIAGKKGWLYEDLFNLVREKDLEDRVIFTGFVEDEEVQPIMAGAEVFVMPSYWEGFGIPVLEAMAAGTPVVCSDQASLPEVAGEAGLYVNPDEPEDIAEKINRVLTDDKLRKDLIQSGREQVKKFSWDKCSQKILKTIINEVN
jgi:glycosyltransferase involved in cell wall biosynthesis